jgi:uncharacterized membrane protein
VTSSERTGLRQAAVLGSVTGARTFVGLAGLAVRGRLGRAAKFVVPVLAAGEMVGDKLAMAPGRSEAPGVAGRVVAGAIAGRVTGGWRGARVGAAFALATTYPSERVRAITCDRTGLVDQAFAVAEDLTVAGASFTAAAEPEREPLLADPATAAAEAGPVPVDQAEPAPPRPSPLAAALHGLAAAAVGTAAMTTAQTAYIKATGTEASQAPGEVGRRIIEGVLQRKVRRNRRDELNNAMHAAYGTQWGLPFGLAVGSRCGGPRAGDGVALGLAVWAIGLAELPALGLAPPPWKQSPADLATDLGFHLVYGLATGAAYEAFAAQ